MTKDEIEQIVLDRPSGGGLNARERQVLDNMLMHMDYLADPYPEVRIFINGISQPGSGEGAYGIVIQYPDYTEEYSGHNWDATHNQMELVAAIEALSGLDTPHEVDVFSSSEWLIKSANGEYWRNYYRYLWDELDRLVKEHVVEWHWIRSRDSPQIQRAHELAQQAQRYQFA